MAFRGASEALAALRHPQLAVETIPGGDHFYTGVRTELAQQIENWLQSLMLTKH